jgi:adenine-specific DNA-methyltransferase
MKPDKKYGLIQGPMLTLSDKNDLKITSKYSRNANVTLFHGDCLDFLQEIPDNEAMLIITSPPYNLGKPYERRLNINRYLEQQNKVISECVRILHPKGSICWQVGNYVKGGEVFPLDILLYHHFKTHNLQLRNRIVWHFEHGLHCSRRFSGRYETILWFTKTKDYVFYLDPLRVKQKYPGKKYFKGPKVGEYSCNPKGKNPGDLWIFPNVKHNHVEKTIHPCQFPIELVERLVLGMTNEGDLVFDPFMGVGTSAVAAIIHGRRAAGADIVEEYLDIARQRLTLANAGLLKTRPMDKPIYEPPLTLSLVKNPFEGK